MKFLGGWINHLIPLILGVFICMNGVDFNLLPGLCIGDTNYMGHHSPVCCRAGRLGVGWAYHGG